MKDYIKDKIAIYTENLEAILEEIEMLEFQMSASDGQVNTKHVGRLMELKILASQVQHDIDKLKVEDYYGTQ